ncbi:MAG: histidinol dehydrogenase, partial [Gammaproteobacteria bacterium HGW-Gammaproteobacteria-7]
MKTYSVAEAKKSILKRQPFGQQAVPQKTLDGIQSLFGESLTPAEAVARILADVRTRGDQALIKWNTKLDNRSDPLMRVSAAEMQSALTGLPDKQLSALKFSIERVRAFHGKQPASSWVDQSMGGTVGQLLRPIRRVGLYVPGGSAPLPSSVIMSAIPAQVAGVKEIVICSPADRATGRISSVTLAAAALVGVEEVYAIGGAQAIATMAFGTQTIKPVDKIFGPGNLFVTLAKQQVFGVVGIDTLAGPTETVIIADDTANPNWVALDLLAQAEHDPLAAAILLTPSAQLAEKVNAEIEALTKGQPAFSRQSILDQSLNDRSGMVFTKDLDEAIDLSNGYAPEHLNLVVSEPFNWIPKIESAGGVFVGEQSFEVLGDYAAGPSHVMPTGGSARYAS